MQKTSARCIYIVLIADPEPSIHNHRLPTAVPKIAGVVISKPADLFDNHADVEHHRFEKPDDVIQRTCDGAAWVLVQNSADGLELAEVVRDVRINEYKGVAKFGG